MDRMNRFFSNRRSMNKTNRMALLAFLAPITMALIYSFYYRESRSTLMERLVDSGVIALLEGGIVTRDDLREYFQYPPVEENELLRSLEITPEDVKEIGLHEKDRELFKEQSGQLLLYQVIKHLSLIHYLSPKYQENEKDGLAASITQYKESLMMEAMENDLAKVSPDVTQEEMLAYFVAHPDEFYRQGKRYARHIMLNADAEDTNPANPFAITPEQVWTRLLNGEDFYTMVVEIRSENSPQEGVLGWLPRGTVHQTFEKALWALEIGEITGPIQVNSTIHFIQLLDEQPDGLIPFSECRARIKSILKENKRILHQYKLLGLNPDSLSVENGELTQEYKKALLDAAYAREWDKNVDIVRKTNAYSRYRKANWMFRQEIKRRMKPATTGGREDNSWFVESASAADLLKKMGFRLLVKLDIPHSGALDKEDPIEE